MITVRQLKYNRTRAASRVKETITFMLTSTAPTLDAIGLPSWWPFWSDALVQNVREAVRAARALEAIEEEP